MTIVWAILIRPLVNFATWNFPDLGDSVFDLFIYSGLAILLGGVVGFSVALAKGNKKLAARLYIIPSLIWQGGILAALLLLVIAFLSYDG
ncbi:MULTISPECIES: hypothetical protein [unclassified Arthrobacter]|uniref:hypothetical protein n=1 Tax=unclassified Arthrobacter TaxID=235627 RepID=UPI0021076B11|nr:MULTISPECIES: hypothetical protein [unclassified Arthrobacter]MCQ1986673.1 hypothetical protein [Arthrobacter sp. zg-Y844]MCQ1995338.1 hypothetical protein [Arthrobacter sp. zg-Y1171]